jgi:glycosyltransferase involved in cell wall biosynthesis
LAASNVIPTMSKIKKKTFIKELPVLSVVIVVYNAVHCLEQTLLSVINQNYTNIELIVIDGNSTDGTIDIIRRLEDNISYWISEPDSGVYDAMNKAVDIATGQWIYFLGAGDILVNIIDKIMPVFIDNSTIYYGDVYRNDILKVYNGRFTPFRLSRVSICHQAMFYPLSAVKKYKFNTAYKVQADHNLNLLLYGDKGYKFKYFSALIALYDGTGISAITKDIPFFKKRLSIIKSNFPFYVYAYAYARSIVAKVLNRKHLEDSTLNH